MYLCDTRRLRSTWGGSAVTMLNTESKSTNPSSKCGNLADATPYCLLMNFGAARVTGMRLRVKLCMCRIALIVDTVALSVDQYT